MKNSRQTPLMSADIAGYSPQMRDDYERIHLKVELHYGDPEISETSEPGEDFRIAMKVQELAQPGSVCATALFHNKNQKKSLVRAESLGTIRLATPQSDV